MPGQSAQANGGKSRIRVLRENTAQWGMPTIRAFTDQRGLYCLKIRTSQGPVYCTTKAYPYQQMASFPARVVRRAADNGCPVAVFFNIPRMGNAYVYLAEGVLQEGDFNEDSAPDCHQTWVDIPLEQGVIFGDWISDRATLE